MSPLVSNFKKPVSKVSLSVRKMYGKYVTNVSGDNILKPKEIEEQGLLCVENPNVSFVATSIIKESYPLLNLSFMYKALKETFDRNVTTGFDSCF